MSNLRNAHVALSILGVKGQYIQTGRRQVSYECYRTTGCTTANRSFVIIREREITHSPLPIMVMHIFLYLFPQIIDFPHGVTAYVRKASCHSNRLESLLSEHHTPDTEETKWIFVHCIGKHVIRILIGPEKRVVWQ